MLAGMMFSLQNSVSNVWKKVWKRSKQNPREISFRENIGISKKKKTNVFMKPVKEKEALVNSVLEQIRIPAITKKVSRRMKIYLFRNDRSMPG